MWRAQERERVAAGGSGSVIWRSCSSSRRTSSFPSPSSPASLPRASADSRGRPRSDDGWRRRRRRRRKAPSRGRRVGAAARARRTRRRGRRRSLCESRASDATSSALPPSRWVTSGNSSATNSSCPGATASSSFTPSPSPSPNHSPSWTSPTSTPGSGNHPCSSTSTSSSRTRPPRKWSRPRFSSHRRRPVYSRLLPPLPSSPPPATPPSPPPSSTLSPSPPAARRLPSTPPLSIPRHPSTVLSLLYFLTPLSYRVH